MMTQKFSTVTKQRQQEKHINNYLGELIYTECDPSFFESIVDNNYIDVTPVEKEPLLIKGI